MPLDYGTCLVGLAKARRSQRTSQRKWLICVWSVVLTLILGTGFDVWLCHYCLLEIGGLITTPRDGFSELVVSFN